MKLKPLKQWFCDACDEVIEKPEDGWVYWSKDRDERGAVFGKVHSFHVVHKFRASPKRAGLEPRESPHVSCYPPNIDQDTDLVLMLGPSGIIRLLSHMDVGMHFDAAGDEILRVKDVRNWTETFRRLHLPYYEQARRHFKQAREEGRLEGEHETSLYNERTLRALVDEYGKNDRSKRAVDAATKKKRFFKADSNAYAYVVARDADHALQILASAGEQEDPDALLELSAEHAARIEIDHLPIGTCLTAEDFGFPPRNN